MSLVKNLFREKMTNRKQLGRDWKLINNILNLYLIIIGIYTCVHAYYTSRHLTILSEPV